MLKTAGTTKWSASSLFPMPCNPSREVRYLHVSSDIQTWVQKFCHSYAGHLSSRTGCIIRRACSVEPEPAD